MDYKGQKKYVKLETKIVDRNLMIGVDVSDWLWHHFTGVIHGTETKYTIITTKYYKF